MYHALSIQDLFRRRAAAEDLPDGHNGYLFDLDSREGDGDDNTQDRYSVDSYECGKCPTFEY
jgi:histone-lysine N-methyltransferase SUV39H